MRKGKCVYNECVMEFYSTSKIMKCTIIIIISNYAIIKNSDYVGKQRSVIIYPDQLRSIICQVFDRSQYVRKFHHFVIIILFAREAYA